ncbi:MAG: VOC family protein [Patescibacteria group bacterium]
MKKPNIPKGHNTANSFIITKDASKLIEFLQEVFGATEDPAAHTVDNDGLLIHSELAIGDSIVMVGDTKPGRPFTPSLLRVYVDDVDGTLKRAKKLGAKIVTEPTDFYGDVFSRFTDPWNNLWWVFKHNPRPKVKLNGTRMKVMTMHHGSPAKKCSISMPHYWKP